MSQQTLIRNFTDMRINIVRQQTYPSKAAESEPSTNVQTTWINQGVVVIPMMVT